MQVSEEELSLVRSEMIDALKLCTDHIKYTITLNSTVIAAGVALLGVSRKIPESDDVMSILAAGAFGSVCFLSLISAKIVRRYYQIYVSNYVYSARLHSSEENRPDHPWLQDINLVLGNKSIFDNDVVEVFMNTWPTLKRQTHSWFYYRCILLCFFAAGVILAASTLIFFGHLDVGA